MDKLVIVGGKPLAGTITVGGAKNAALPIVFSCLLTSEECRFGNVPRLRDMDSSLAVLRSMGAEAGQHGNRVTVSVQQIKSSVAPYDLVRTMRASVLVLGPLLARCGRATVALPGGCAIGARPVDIHIRCLQAMGADIRLENGNIEAQCKRLHGARLVLPQPTVTGTENLLMAATLARGETVIENAAREPEVVDLINCLKAMGAEIEGGGSGTIWVQGKPTLSGVSYRIMPDRIEAGTYIAAVAACGGDVLLRAAGGDTLQNIVAVFADGGVRLREEKDGLRVSMHERFRAMDADTAPYPGFPTDMQAQLIAANCVGKGRAAVTESVFENRFMHVQELLRMGAKIELHNNTAFVTGVSQLTAAPVMATDLRASASLVIAALAAEGRTVINRVYHLDRGYERMERKLRALGADVRRRR